MAGTVFVLSLGLAGGLLAARRDVRTMTCDQGRSLVASSGQVVLTTGDSTYDRIVHNRGFCTPGQLMTATALLNSVPRPDAAQVKDALVGVLCRCSNYNAIVEAVVGAAAQPGGVS